MAKLGKVTWLGMTHSLLSIDLGYLERRVEEVEADRLRDFERHVHAKAQRLQSEERDEWYEWNHDRHWELSDVFPKMVRHALFTTANSFLEEKLFQLARGLAHQTPKRVSLDDLKGETIVERARVYLTKVQRIDFPAGTEWSRLAEYRRIRNRLVHADGRVDGTKQGQAVRRFLQRHPHLGTVNDRNRITLELEAARDMIRTMKTFFATLYDNARVAERRRKARKRTAAVTTSSGN